MNEITTIVVANSLPAQIVAIADTTLAEVATLTQEAAALVVRDAESLESANGIYKKIDALNKAISTKRLEITRPIDALKKEIIAAEERATKPLTDAKADLGKRILECQRSLEQARREAEERARREAEAKAEEERQRLEAERQAKIKADQEARDRELEEKRREAELFGEDPSKVVVDEPPPPPPVVVVPRVIEPEVVFPSVPKAAVGTSTRKKLVIIDAKLIPIEIAGVRLLLPDEKAIMSLLKAGVDVPGCRLDDVETIRSAGGRGR